MQAVGDSYVLRVLDISFQNIGDQGAAAVADALKVRIRCSFHSNSEFLCSSFTLFISA